uniref:(northern house mosquito) hypothetical protein n=1 Tax=Culex pipiens TaxID=7175 RepID=A0A8D8EV38_CULPI
MPREPPRRNRPTVPRGHREKAGQTAGTAAGQVHQTSPKTNRGWQKEARRQAGAQDEGTVRDHRVPKAGQPHELWRHRRGRVPGGSGVLARHHRQNRHRPHPTAPDRREDQGAHQQDAAEEPAEAAAGLGRQHHRQEANLRHGVQCGVHAAPGPGDCEPAGGGTARQRKHRQVFLQHVRLSVGGKEDDVEWGVSGCL